MKAVKLQCKLCNTVIFSKYPGHYCACECGAIAVDQNEHYIRTIGESTNIINVEDDTKRFVGLTDKHYISHYDHDYDYDMVYMYPTRELNAAMLFTKREKNQLLSLLIETESEESVDFIEVERETKISFIEESIKNKYKELIETEN
ncbi:MAG: DUF7695 domain-containing protein [Cetobacterium sp.]